MKIYVQASMDLFHMGHVNLLKKCKKLAGKDGLVIVSLISDNCYEKYRGYAPTMNWDQRAAVVDSCKYVDIVIEGDNRFTRDELITHEPDVVVLGTDWVEKDIYKHYNLTQEWYDNNDIILLFLPRTEGISTSEVKRSMK